jgi:hypothetical protein
MTRNIIRLSDQLELPAPAGVAMIFIAAAFAKGGHSFLGIGAMIAFQALFVVAKLASVRLNARRAAIEIALVAMRPGLWLVPIAPVILPAPASPVPPRDPRPTAAPQIPYRQAA